MAGESRGDAFRAALDKLGEPDVLAWARRNCATPLYDLSRSIGVRAPIDLQRYMAELARERGSYHSFALSEMIRGLNTHLPTGVTACDSPDAKLAAVWAMWAAGLIEPGKKPEAQEAWNKLQQALREHPDWCPRSPDDPHFTAAFAGANFEPSEEYRAYRHVWNRIEREVLARGSTDADFVQALAQMPIGYGCIAGITWVDGEICNGGFWQLYENSGGAYIHLAIEGFRMIGRDHHAALLTESLAAAAQTADLKLIVEIPAGIPTPRPLEDLDGLYYALSESEPGDWLELALVDLLRRRPELF